MLCLMIWNEEAKRMSKYLYRLADGCRVLTKIIIGGMSMTNRIKSLADVKLPSKEELRAIVFNKYLALDEWNMPFVNCKVCDACYLLEHGHIMKMETVFDDFEFIARCTDIIWLIEIEQEHAIYYVLLKCTTEPAENDIDNGYSHMVFEKYNFEIIPRYI